MTLHQAYKKQYIEGLKYAQVIIDPNSYIYANWLYW